MRQLSRHLMNLSLALSVWGAAAYAEAQATPPATANAQATAQTETAQPAAPAPDLRVKSVRAKSEPYMEPATSEVRRIPNRGLLSTGSVLFIGSYVPSVIVAAARDDVSDNLYYPIAGPWMEIAQEEPDAGGKTLLAIDGVVQGLGTLMMLGSFVVPERSTQSWYLLGNRHFQLSPNAGRSAYGLSARGTF